MFCRISQKCVEVFRLNFLYGQGGHPPLFWNKQNGGEGGGSRWNLALLAPQNWWRRRQAPPRLRPRRVSPSLEQLSWSVCHRRNAPLNLEGNAVHVTITVCLTVVVAWRLLVKNMYWEHCRPSMLIHTLGWVAAEAGRTSAGLQKHCHNNYQHFTVFGQPKRSNLD